jgi:hypothetical protein
VLYPAELRGLTNNFTINQVSRHAPYLILLSRKITKPTGQGYRIWDFGQSSSLHTLRSHGPWSNLHAAKGFDCREIRP